MDYLSVDQLFEQSQAVLTEAKNLAAKPDATAEDVERATKLFEDAKSLKGRSKLLTEMEGAVAETKATLPKPRTPAHKFTTLGDFLSAVHTSTFGGRRDERLVFKGLDNGETDYMPKTAGKATWEGDTKDLVENTGASGGFLVPPEYRATFMMMQPFQNYVRSRAMVIPMRGRQITIPTLDQTGTSNTSSNFYGGVIAKWTEEATQKYETEPAFRQDVLIAHKLITYTEASDELLADSAIGLEVLLGALFGMAIAGEEEWTFINGTGTGKPLGVVPAGATFHQARAVAGAIGIGDVFNMLSHFMGVSPVWVAHQSTLPSILGLNGPAGNPSYVWISNAVSAAPTTLMGYPIFFTENAPTLGLEGDLGLYDFSKYLIGDRQATAIDSSKHYRFQYDLTAWRGVHRVDGRPWLSAPLTLRDGVTQVSPFVILDDAVIS